MSWSANGYRFLKPIRDLDDPDSLLPQMQQFLEHLRVKGYSQQTLFGYERYLRDFIVWGQSRGILRTGDLTLQNIARYQTALSRWITRRGTPLAKLSQLGKLIPLRSFLGWLARSLPDLRAVLAEMELPRVPRRIPRHICTASDIGRILRQPDPTTLLGLRDRAILELFYSTGMRRMELVGLVVDDIDHARASIIIRHGKGDRSRMVPVGRQAIDWIDEYLERGRPYLLKRTSDHLFLTRGGQPISGAWLSGIVSRYIAKSNTGKKGSCHLLRHSMATLMLENGADIRFIQEILGHAQLSTTQIYTHVSVAQLQKVHAATHPSERAVHRRMARTGLVRRRPSGLSAAELLPDPSPLQSEVLALLQSLPADAGWLEVLALIKKRMRIARVEREMAAG